MLSGEQLRLIDNLQLPTGFSEWSNERVEEYCSALSEYVEKFSKIEAELKKTLFIGDTGTLSLTLAELAGVLASIYAEDLARECERIRNSVADVEAEALEADVVVFLALVATLSIDIQMELYKSAAAIRPKTRKHPALNADAQKSVLAVDDIPATLNLIKQPVTAAGYKFNGVTSGAAALDFITKFTPDIFILDIEMPNMNGFELAAKIREAGHGTPIIFLTGNTTREYLHKAVQAGAAGFIVKPPNGNVVSAKIKKILDG